LNKRHSAGKGGYYLFPALKVTTKAPPGIFSIAPDATLFNNRQKFADYEKIFTFDVKKNS
jgi:hypothetical protein